MSQFNRFINRMESIFSQRVCRWDFKNKNFSVYSHIENMLNKTNGMFEIKGLPDTIPEHITEEYLQENGFHIVAEVEGSLYALTGTIGGELTENYEPKTVIVNNPWLKLKNGDTLSKEYTIGKDCVLIRNDKNMTGLVPIFSKYGELSMETELSLVLANYNSRWLTLGTGSSDEEKESMDIFLKHIIDGDLSSVVSSNFMDGLKTQNGGGAGAASNIVSLIELLQYIKASELNEIGLNANYNMKREAINSNESQLNDDALMPLLDEMEYWRHKGWDEVNKLFGTNVSVDRKGPWKNREEEQDLQIENMKNGDTEPADGEQKEDNRPDNGREGEGEKEDE